MSETAPENEIRLFGPPGTGKTTWISNRVKDTVKHRGSDRVIACSFTKTAAAELSSRDMPLPSTQIGTLHSLAYRAIDRPPVADEIIGDWNDRNHDLALSGGKAPPEDIDMIEGHFGQTDGDKFMQQVDRLRALQVPEDLWAYGALSFWKRWSEWKQEEGVVDFTDMIEIAINETEVAPGDPLVGFFDEVQDFTPLELRLIRHWGSKMDRIILGGDDDQCLYSFKGATPQAFLNPPIREENKRLLEQSYRVPFLIHAAAQRWIERCSMREEKDYHPRDADGRIRRGNFNWQTPEPVVEDIADRVAEGRTVMVLTATGYQLDKIKHRLRSEGIPFHNPYRRKRGDWNPLGRIGGKSVSASDRVIAFLRADPDRVPDVFARPWTGKDLKAWIGSIVAKGILVRGAKQIVGQMADNREVPYEEIVSLFGDDEHLARALEVDLSWFASHLLKDKARSLDFPLKIADRIGVLGLVEEPKVILGTIHSVKGAQSDVVYLFPDLSSAGFRQWQTADAEGNDSIIRQFYVGMTRAREELVIGEGANQLSIDPELMLAGAVELGGVG